MIQKVKKIITDPSVSYQIFLKYMKGFSLNKFQNILNNFFPNFNVDSENVSVLNIACCQCLRNGNQLSKAFDCLSHDLLIAKLNANGFSMAALRLVQNYLSNRKQRTKINTEYSSWEEILFGVPQGSILGPLLFNIFLCDLFLIMNNTELASYADDNTPYVVGNNKDELIVRLQNASKTLFQWFSDNQMKSNPDKCNFICSTSKKVSLIVENKEIKNSARERLLRVKNDSKLSFNTHFDDMCKKTSN